MPESDSREDISHYGRGRDDIQIWREIAGQGSTLRSLTQTTVEMRADFRKHQDDEVVSKERDRMALDIMSGNLASHSREVASGFAEFQSSVNARLDTFEGAMNGQFKAINETLAENKGGSKMLYRIVSWLGAVVIALGGFIAWALSYLPHFGGKP